MTLTGALDIGSVKSKKKKVVSSAKEFAVEAARIAAGTRGRDVVVLDVTGISPVTDFYVLATGTSERQMKAVMDEIAEIGRGMGYRALSMSDGELWMLGDFVDVVVHVFSEEGRLFYDLDNLWGDAKKVAWGE